MKNEIRQCAMVFAALSCAAFGAKAQTADIGQAQAPGQLEEIVVTAQK